MPKQKEAPPTTTAHDVEEVITISPIRPSDLKTKRKLTLDVLSISKIGAIVMQCNGELQLAEFPSKFSANGKAPAYCIDVTDCETGEQYTLICNTVLSSALKRAAEPLTGRFFKVKVGDVRPGKTYRDTEVYEQELKK